VQVWSVTSDPTTGAYTHTLKTGSGHALMVPLVCSVFELLDLSASLYDGRFWWVIHTAPSRVPFEVQHGVDMERWDYNGRSFELVRKTKKSFLGRHAGCSDVFVPVVMEGQFAAVLVVGSFAVARPTSADVLDRWHAMTGRQGHPTDPAFLAFLRATLSMPVLDGGRERALMRLVECLAELLASRGNADELANQAQALRLELEPTRFVDRVWEAARAMVDERSSQAHYAGARAFEMHRLGLERAPDQVLVGLARARAENVDPVDELVVRDALQRSAVELAHTAGDAIAGRVGDHGVVFLSAAKGSATDRKTRLFSLGAKAASLAERRFGLTLHFGAGLGSGAAPLSRTYQDALGAAESALTSNRKLVLSDPSARQRGPSLRALRDELARSVEEDPGALSPKLDRYLEAVAARTGYRIEPARAQLEILLEGIADGLLRSGALDPKSLSGMREGLDRAASEAATVSDLFAAYRQTVADMSAAVRAPVAARRGRGLRGALEYIHQHYAEALPLAQIARVAGFAPKYFSQLFRKKEQITFERYLLRLRIDRAKRLLSGTDLNVTRVAELSGLGNPQYLCRVFRRALRVTPLEYRASLRPEWTKKLRGRGPKHKRT
jgi:AraC-like DNA-binding protein